MSLRNGGSDVTTITVPENTPHLRVGQECRELTSLVWSVSKVRLGQELPPKIVAGMCSSNSGIQDANQQDILRTH